MELIVLHLQTTFSLIAPPVVNFLAKDPLVDKYDLSQWTMPFSGAATLSQELTEAAVTRLGLQGIKQGACIYNVREIPL